MLNCCKKQNNFSRTLWLEKLKLACVEASSGMVDSSLLNCDPQGKVGPLICAENLHWIKQ